MSNIPAQNRLRTPLIAILAVVLLAAAGWAVYATMSQSNPSDAAQISKPAEQAEETPMQTDEQNYLVIKEWGVKLPTQEAILSDATYQILASGSVCLTTEKYEKLARETWPQIDEPSCSSWLERGKADDKIVPASAGDPTAYKELFKDGIVTKIGDYYYFWRSGQAAFGPDGFSYKVTVAFKDAFGKITAE